jgi:hypothetical protein
LKCLNVGYLRGLYLLFNKIDCSAESNLLADLLRAADLLLDHASDERACSDDGSAEGSGGSEDGS